MNLEVQETDFVVIDEKAESTEDSNLIKHAKHELSLIGYTNLDDVDNEPNKWMYGDVMALLHLFAKQGHSGFSAPHCISLFSKLANYEILSPLTGEDCEWNEVGTNVYQNKRCSHVFMDESGRAYDIYGRIFRCPNGSCYTSKGSAVDIEFPYTPKKEYIDVEE